MRKYLITLSFLILAPTSTAKAVDPSDFNLKEGELISAIFSKDPDVYIINQWGYKRLFLNPEIFKFYGHLGGFASVKLVTPEIRDAFPTSSLFRSCETNDQKVYSVEVDNEDVGKLRWINTPGDQAVKDDPDFFKKVFCINDKEFNWYPKGQEFKSVKEITQYQRAIPAISAIPAIPASTSHPFTPIASVSQPLTPSIIPKPASGSFTLTPTPTPVSQPATPAMPATPAIPTTIASTSASAPSVDKTPPNPPTNLTAKAIYSTTGYSPNTARVDLKWSPSTSTNLTTTGNGGNQIFVNGVQSSFVEPIPCSISYEEAQNPGSYSFSTSDYPKVYLCSYLSNLKPSTFYTFELVVRDTAGNDSVKSAPVSITTPIENSGICTATRDTDNGINYNVKGSITDTVNIVREDVCLNPTDAYSANYNLMELSCSVGYGDRPYGSVSKTPYKCLYGCSNGVCNSAPAPTPTPTPTPTPSTPAASISFDSFSRNLTMGSTGNDVKQLQALLVNEVGYPTNLITSYFGDFTRNAVKKLQEKYKITPALGYFGQKTRQKLNTLYLK